MTEEQLKFVQLDVLTDVIKDLTSALKEVSEQVKKLNINIEVLHQDIKIHGFVELV